jgi:Protein of unknown function (DUF3433)
MAFVFWAITPLQGGIFNQSTVTRQENIFIPSPSQLVPIGRQAERLNGTLMNDGYGVVWLGQELPAYTTREDALAPFAYSTPAEVAVNQTMISNTTLYGTDLRCAQPASVSRVPGEEKGTRLLLDDGVGCKESSLFRDSADFIDSMNTNGYVTRLCQKYVILWKRSLPSLLTNTTNTVTLFCQPQYYTHMVRANVSLPKGHVLSVSPMGPKVTMTNELFNSSHFESLVTKDTSPLPPSNMTIQKWLPRPFDISEDNLINQQTSLVKKGFPLLSSALAGLAIGSQNFSSADYTESLPNIETAFQAAHRLLFSLAMNSLLYHQNSTVAPQAEPAIRGLTSESVQLFRPITRALEVFLVLVIILNLILLCRYWNRFLPFRSDPNSIAYLATVTARRLSVLNYFSDVMSSGLERRKFTLRNDQQGLSLAFARSDEEDRSDSPREKGLINHASTNLQLLQSRATWPFELKMPAGIAFVSALCAGFVGLVVVQQRIRSNNGLPLPPGNTTVQQIFLNYVPLLYGTIIEPFWVLISRYICFLQPFEDLKQGSANASKTILQKYTSSPPQWVLFPALKNRHFRLASASLATILANLLTIALSGLFATKTVAVPTDIAALQIYDLRVNQSFVISTSSLFFDPSVVQPVLSNLSADTPLPPWTTQERFYFPLNITSASSDPDSTTYKLTTRGFEGSLDCTVLPENTGDFHYTLFLNEDATEANFQTTRIFPNNGTEVHCFSPRGETNTSDISSNDTQSYPLVSLAGDSSGRSGFEMFHTPMFSPDISDEDNSASCGDAFVGGWIRSNITFSNELTNSSDANPSLSTGPTAKTTFVFLDKLFLTCEPRVYAAEYNVTTDTKGTILSAQEIPGSNFTLDTLVASGFLSQTKQLLGSGSLLNPATFWHHDSKARDWMSLFVQKLQKSTALTDPLAPLPDPAALSRDIADVFRRLWAVNFAMNTHVLLRSEKPPEIPSKKLILETRVFMSHTMFIIAFTILGLDIAIAVILYADLSAPFLPHMPTSLAGVIVYFAPTQWVRELQEQGNAGPATPEELVSTISEGSRRYRFGRFKGTTDGAMHVGIEREPYVMPLVEDKDGGGTVRRRWKWRGEGRWGLKGYRSAEQEEVS